MAPRLLLAAYHPASGTERAYSGVGVGKSSERQQALRARKAVVGAKVAMEPSELLVNAAVAEGITSIATVHDSFGCLPRRPSGSAGSSGSSSWRYTRSMTCCSRCLIRLRRDLKDPKALPKPPERLVEH